MSLLPNGNNTGLESNIKLGIEISKQRQQLIKPPILL